MVQQQSAWVRFGLVALGGAVGAGSREALSRTIPDVGDVPVVIVVVNVVGAFALGLLYAAVTRLDGGRAGRLKLLLGTGVCGGFTTYSSLATDTAVLVRDGHAGLAVLYSLGTVALGACATVLGILAGTPPRDRGARA